jgi:hypothetical protein
VEIYTSRYFNYELLSSGLITPVRISMFPPLMELPYQLKYSVRALQPERSMIGEWPRYSNGFWRKLERVGMEAIARELAEIRRTERGRPLALLCYEDLMRGHRCHRVIFSLFWEQHAGERVHELTDEGEVLALEQLHRQTAPILDLWSEGVPRWRR